MADGDGSGSQSGTDSQQGAPDSGSQSGQQTNGAQSGEQQTPQTPPWGSDEQFDPEKAWKLIQNVRADAEKAKADRDSYKSKIDAHEQSKLSDAERLTADRDSYKTRAEQAEGQLLRMEVAAAKGLTVAQAKRLQGSSKEELEADADELVQAFGASRDGGSKSGPPSNRPREQYRGGTSDPGEAPDEIDPRKLADAIGNASSGGFRVRR